MRQVLGRATSSNVQIVMWGLAELGLAAERLDYGHAFGGLDTDEFGALNPNRMVPVLKDGDLVVWESAAILRYLATRYGDGGAFWPADPAARAPVDMWAEWGKTTLGPALIGPIFWPRVRKPAAERDEAALVRAIARFGGLLDILQAQIGRAGGYIAGPEFSVADIVCGHLFYRYYTMDIARPDHPGVADWYHRLAGRPAFRDHVMVSYAPLTHPDAG